MEIMLDSMQVNVRAAAKELGLRAIKQAAATEQHEKALTQQRKANRAPLTSKEDLRAAAAAVANGWMLPQSPGPSLTTTKHCTAEPTKATLL